MAHIPTFKPCSHCGISYRVNPARFHTSRFCSYACMGAAQAKHPEPKTCERCGKIYERSPDESPARFARSKYCSRLCSGQAAQTLPQVQAARNSSSESTPELKTCEICGTLYGPGTRKPHQFRKSKYCSIQCSAQSQWRGLEHVLSRIVPDPATGCHNWSGNLVGSGYGSTKLNGKRILVHRLVWEQRNGLISDGLQIDHICRNTKCCNVEHLRLVTPEVNILASENMAAHYASRDVCDKCGGPFSTFPSGIRYCKSCRHAAQMDYQRWQRAERKAGRPGLRRDYKESE